MEIYTRAADTKPAFSAPPAVTDNWNLPQTSKFPRPDAGISLYLHIPSQMLQGLTRVVEGKTMHFLSLIGIQLGKNNPVSSLEETKASTNRQNDINNKNISLETSHFVLGREENDIENFFSLNFSCSFT